MGLSPQVFVSTDVELLRDFIETRRHVPTIFLSAARVVDSEYRVNAINAAANVPHNRFMAEAGNRFFVG